MGRHGVVNRGFRSGGAAVAHARFSFPRLERLAQARRGGARQAVRGFASLTAAAGMVARRRSQAPCLFGFDGQRARARPLGRDRSPTPTGRGCIPAATQCREKTRTNSPRVSHWKSDGKKFRTRGLRSRLPRKGERRRAGRGRNTGEIGAGAVFSESAPGRRNPRRHVRIQ